MSQMLRKISEVALKTGHFQKRSQCDWVIERLIQFWVGSVLRNNRVFKTELSSVPDVSNYGPLL